MAIELEVLRRAYELHCTTDLTLIEIARALYINAGDLAGELSEVTGEKFEDPTKKISSSVLNYLRENKRNSDRRKIKDIAAGTGLSLEQAANAIKKLKQNGLIRVNHYRLDRRIKIYRAVI